MPGVVTFWILVGTVLLIGVLFFQVVKPLVLPLFMGAVLAILFHPLFIRCLRVCRGRLRLAAALATTVVVLIVLGPFVLIGKFAVGQASHFVREHLPGNAPAAAASPASSEEMPDEYESADDSPEWLDGLFRSETTQKLLGRLEPYGVSEREARAAAERLVSWMGGQVGPRAYDLAGAATRFLIDTFMLIIALYFYFSDGPQMLKTLDELTPLPPGRGAELFWEFENVCRAVVFAMFATAFMNGVLSGIGFWMAGVPHVLMLSVIMMIMSFIPFIGMASVWGSVCVYLYLEGHPGATLFIAIWCGGFVNTLDHFVRPYLIGGRAKLHPLFVFASVFGGIHLLGVLGIFIGPIVGAVLYALLKILRAELPRVEAQSGRPKTGTDSRTVAGDSVH